ncbi:UTP--glucose-1-phosphate uridylyltransferase [Aeromicrobium sp. YIM 150415]|uniref:UTP--glucose-1-phosphate uridylyltransferase n=1 Tax=Aeromicrobium sp. YIM 150415 TaxID=2803912 RepID=UPI001962B324|nr:UTP--glucose-1-phosphate uridylyltransferase [Aeromicrobium sp. YIM 150415]MBM9462000.1 UTP--glucose-1-phosphate uridylyltransferase [Aeromicrobium sp. YIM 150415]
MHTAGVPQQAIDVFSDFYAQLESGASGAIRESDVDPLRDIDAVADLAFSPEEARAAAQVTAIVKLNGGLGTSMGMDRAKSLLRVREDATFLDIIARQVTYVRENLGARLPLLFMDSFRTRDDTLAALVRHPDLAYGDLPLDFLQNREPKLRADTLAPVDWPDDPSLEWCPPGHGDLYTALQTSGVLDRLIGEGFRYVSVSNSDNLGAAPDPQMMAWFAQSGAPYAAEVCERTPADVKGGHLVVRKRDGRLVLRETAQTAAEDEQYATDPQRHRYFHTNNLWFDLVRLREVLNERRGVIGLPLIRNEKTVDPTDPSSPKVVQIESAMGAAVEVFDGATAIEVPRSRFLPVKTTNDLALLRSDVYELGADGRLRAGSAAPLVSLDRDYFTRIADFERRVPEPLSLVRATRLRVEGDVSFEGAATVIGDVTVTAPQGESRNVAAGTVLRAG